MATTAPTSANDAGMTWHSTHPAKSTAPHGAYSPVPIPRATTPRNRNASVSEMEKANSDENEVGAAELGSTNRKGFGHWRKPELEAEGRVTRT